MSNMSQPVRDKEVEKKTQTTVTEVKSLEKHLSTIKSAKELVSPRHKIQRNQLLKLYLVEAKINRTSLDQTDNPDTYVVITHGAQTVKSKTVTKSNLAKFNEEFTLLVSDVRTWLEISVWEVKKGEKEELIGKGSRNIEYLSYGEKDDNVMQLYPRVEIKFVLEPTNYGRYKTSAINVEDYSDVERNEMEKKALKGEKLADLYNAMNRVTFDEDKIKLMDKALDDHYVRVSDLCTLIDCFHFSYYQFLFCENAIPKIIDLRNYGHIKNKLTFEDDRDSFEQRVLYFYIQKLKINYKSKAM